MIRTLFSCVSGVIFALAYIPYTKQLLLRKATPAPRLSSWLNWSAMNIVAFYTMVQSHTVNPVIFAATMGTCTVTAIIIFTRQGTMKWTRLDRFCVGVGVLGVILWKVTGDPVVGTAISLTVNVIGSFPTIESVWYNPENEPKPPWVMMWCATLLQILSKWGAADTTAITLLQPLMYISAQSVIVALLFLPPPPFVIEYEK